MPDLYPTPTRLKLLRAVERGDVIEGVADDHTYWVADPPDLPLKVCARIEEMNGAGWVTLPEQDAPVTWRLTDAGREVLAEAEQRRTA